MNPIRTLRPLFQFLSASAPLALPLAASAAPITGVTCTASSTYVHSTVSTANLVNNSGLSIANDVTATHAAFGGANPGNGWHSTNTALVDNQFVTFNLNGTRNVANIYIWQMSQAGQLGRGIRQFDLLVSSDGVNFTEVASNLELAQSPGGAVNSQSFALNQTGITHVRIGIDSAWSGATNEYVGLSEVKFTETATASEVPTFSPSSGTLIGAQTVTISSATLGSTIYYTTDGSTPTNASQSGASPVAVIVPAGTTTTLNAYSQAAGLTDSTVSTATYTTLATSSGVWTNTAGGSWGVAGNWQGSAVPFAGTADFNTLTLPGNGIVTLDGPQTIGHLVFGDLGATYDWQLSTAGPLTLDNGSSASTVTVNNRTTTISSVVAGARGLTKAGTGTLALTGANTYTGPTSLNAGTLVVSDPASHRSSIAIATGASFEANSTATTFAPNSYDITGTGTLVKTGTGTWGLGAAGRVGISMSPGASIQVLEGTIATGNHKQSWTDNKASMFLAAGATVDLPAENLWVDALTGGGSIVNTYAPSGGRTVYVGVADGSGTFTGTIGSGNLLGLTKSGTGTEILTGANTYTGTTTISSGTLQLGNGGTSGSLATGSTIVNNGTLAFNRSDAISQGTHFSGNLITGSGGLTKMGSGTLTLTANNSYTGITAVTSGTLATGLAPGNLWSVAQLDLANGTTLSLQNFDSTSGNAAVDATQSLTCNGTVTINVSGNFTVGEFPLIWYPVEGGISGAGFNSLVLGTLPDGVTAELVDNPETSSIELHVSEVIVTDPFQSWITTNYPSLTGDDALPGADPDRDGLDNRGEFAFKGDPTSGGSRGPAAVATTDTNGNTTKELVFTVAVRSGASFSDTPSPSATIDGVKYTIEGSLALDQFDAPVSELTPALTPAQTGLPDITGSGWEYRSFILDGSEGLTGKGFLRAKAEAP